MMDTTGGRDLSTDGARDDSSRLESRALLRLRTPDGRAWSAGALLTSLTAHDNGEERSAESFQEEGLQCSRIEVIV